MTKEQPTVLLAEDDPDHQYIARTLLEHCGCRVIEAMNGEEAVELALRERPDLILLDLKMPVLDGFDAALLIRLNLPEVPMVAYTGIYSYSHTEDALKAGFDDYIRKPVDAEKMQELLDHHLKAK